MANYDPPSHPDEALLKNHELLKLSGHVLHPEGNTGRLLVELSFPL